MSLSVHGRCGSRGDNRGSRLTDFSGRPAAAGRPIGGALFARDRWRGPSPRADARSCTRDEMNLVPLLLFLSAHISLMSLLFASHPVPKLFAGLSFY